MNFNIWKFTVAPVSIILFYFLSLPPPFCRSLRSLPKQMQDSTTQHLLALLTLALVRSLTGDEADELQQALLHHLLGVLGDLHVRRQGLLHDPAHVRDWQDQRSRSLAEPSSWSGSRSQSARPEMGSARLEIWRMTRDGLIGKPRDRVHRNESSSFRVRSEMGARDGDQRRGKEKRRGRGREMGKKMGTTVKKIICGWERKWKKEENEKDKKNKIILKMIFN